MAVVADVDVAADEFVLGRALDRVGPYRAELTQFVPTGEQFLPYLRIEAEDGAEVESVLRAHPAVAEVTTFDERVGRGLYRIEWTRPLDGLLSILRDGDVLVTEARGTPDGWEFELLAGEEADLAAFQSACTRKEVPIEIRAISRSGPTSSDRVGLTERQHRILQLAYERGYFTVPRAVTITELGEELDISPQAASKLMRRGLETAVGYIFQGPS